MIPGCAVVLAGLCIAAPYDRATQLSAMYRPDDGRTGVADPEVVRRLGVRIDAYQSDLILSKLTAGAAATCVNGGCVIYAKSCSADGLECLYEWAIAPKGAPWVTGTLKFSIHATSAAAMRAA